MKSKSYHHLTPLEDRIIRINVEYQKTEWNKWVAHALPLARERQAMLMAAVDFRGLTEASEGSGGYVSGSIPMLWPMDAATFEFAENKPSKNSVKPGEHMVCPTFSGTPAIVEVVSRRGKNQTLRVIDGPDDLMIGKTFFWHADHNNILFRMLSKRDMKNWKKSRVTSAI